MAKRTSKRRDRTHGSPEHEQLALAVLKQFRIVYGSMWRHFRRVERSSGVSGSQAWILQELRDRPGVGVTELAGRLSIHQSTCSQLTAKLVRSGHVAKRRGAHDQRRVGLYLSKRGERALARVPQPAQGVLPAALASLSDTALRALHADLKRVLRRIEKTRTTDAATHLAEL